MKLIFEKDHFSEKIFRNVEKTPSKFKYINFRDLFCFLYNRWHQSTNWSAIAKIKYPGHFFEKLILPRFNEFYGLHDDLKIIWNTFNPWPKSWTAFRTNKKNDVIVIFSIFPKSCASNTLLNNILMTSWRRLSCRFWIKYLLVFLVLICEIFDSVGPFRVHRCFWGYNITVI